VVVILHTILIMKKHWLIFREGRGNAHLTGNYKRIGDVVLHNFDSVTMEYYMRYVDTHGIILEKLERVLATAMDPSNPGNYRFGQVFRDFESQKVCYLPLTTLILKPLQRILHYELLLERNTLICIFLMMRPSFIFVCIN
jgi:FERM/RhoGEF/pleckstrin domain protein 2